MNQKQIFNAIRWLGKQKYRKALNLIKREEEIPNSRVKRYCANLNKIGILKSNKPYRKIRYYTDLDKIQINYSSYGELELMLFGDKKEDYRLDLKPIRYFIHMKVFDALRQPKLNKELSRAVGIDASSCCVYVRNLMGLGLVSMERKKHMGVKKPIYETTIKSFSVNYEVGCRTGVRYRPKSTEINQGNLWYLIHGKPVSELGR